MIPDFKLYSDKQILEMTRRATGRTTRLIDKLIQEFFEKPVGTKILVCDHFGTKQDDRFLLDKLVGRIKSEHPNIDYQIIQNGGGFLIKRTSKTYHECVEEEYKRRQEKTKEE